MYMYSTMYSISKNLSHLYVTSFLFQGSLGATLKEVQPTLFFGVPRYCILMCIQYTYTCTCGLMRRRIKVAGPRIFLISAAYLHIREEVVDENPSIT